MTDDKGKQILWYFHLYMYNIIKICKNDYKNLSLDLSIWALLHKCKTFAVKTLIGGKSKGKGYVKKVIGSNCSEHLQTTVFWIGTCFHCHGYICTTMDI